MKDATPPSCPLTPIPEHIGPYKILKKIASGGMGEVFLAQDPFCKRNIALKKIRSDKINHPGLKERFLKEVKIAAQLSHPSIIPIYQIHQTEDEIYYTMPLVEGETLKEIIKKTLHQEKEGKAEHPIGSSIPALMRIFLTICQAIAYSHSKGVLHRDLKPENIIIGPYGEVLILDWGLADFVHHTEEEQLPFLEEEELCDLTKPGKIAGTLCYLPPERIFGTKASYASDIYALGVILYQLLTLRIPFKRKSIKEYKQQIKHEKFPDPVERAPYRDIPPQLSRIAKKCLFSRPEKRYKSVEEILIDLNNYIEGHADWIPQASIQVANKADWKFQENILLTKHIALTQKSDIREWVNLMIAKGSFPGRIKLETHVNIKEGGQGIGFFLNLRPPEEGKDLFQDGFFIWIGSQENPGCYLFRSNVELMSNPNLALKKHLPYFIRIQKTDYHVRLWINNLLAFDYLSHTPFNGPHFGLVLKDEDLEVGTILVSSRSPNIQVNCLAVPDTLLALHHFKEALSGYRQIASSFAGRAEGKEALFRAGITLLEEARYEKGIHKKHLLKEALQEFDTLTDSPLEYLGKSLVYKTTQELEEELKCLELALLKFAKHPLIHLVKDEILFRLHEASYKDRKAAYEFALLTLRRIPNALSKQDHQKLLQHLQKNCEELDFLDKEHLAIQLAFWLAKPLTLFSIFKESPHKEEKNSALYALLHLGYEKEVLTLTLPTEFQPIIDFYRLGFEKTSAIHFSDPKTLFTFTRKRAFDFILSRFYFVHLKIKKAMVKQLESLRLSYLSLEERLFLEKRLIEFLLYLGEIKKASLYLEGIPTLVKEQESSPFYFLQGCLIAKEKGFTEAKAFLARIVEKPHPPSSHLVDAYFSHVKTEKTWMDSLFFAEKIHLFRQLSLLYLLVNQKKTQKLLQKRIQKTILDLHKSYPLHIY